MSCTHSTVYTIEGASAVKIQPAPGSVPIAELPPPFVEPIDDLPETRQYKDDFETTTFTVNRLSTTRRPDAVAFDHQVAFSLGPIAYGDGSGGANVKVWKATVHEDGIYVARENDAGDGWNEEQLVFSPNNIPEEISLAFEQNGQPVIAVESEGGIYLYWFNTAAEVLDENGIPQGAFQYTFWNNGHTPRLLLDYPEVPSISDVLLAYMSTDHDCLVVRQQRDRYGTAYETPVTDAANSFLELMYRTKGFRVEFIYSVHGTLSGIYEFRKFFTTLYPVAQNDANNIVPQIQRGIFLDDAFATDEIFLYPLLQSAAFLYDFLIGFDSDYLFIAPSLYTAEIVLLLNINLFEYFDQGLLFGPQCVYGLFYDPLIHARAYDPLSLGMQIQPTGIIVHNMIVYTHPQSNEDSWKIFNNTTLQSGIVDEEVVEFVQPYEQGIKYAPTLQSGAFT